MISTLNSRRQTRLNKHLFVTIASRLNFDAPIDEVSERNSIEEPKGYPDFFDDSDAINRYLW